MDDDDAVQSAGQRGQPRLVQGLLAVAQRRRRVGVNLHHESIGAHRSGGQGDHQGSPPGGMGKYSAAASNPSKLAEKPRLSSTGRSTRPSSPN